MNQYLSSHTNKCLFCCLPCTGKLFYLFMNSELDLNEGIHTHRFVICSTTPMNLKTGKNNVNRLQEAFGTFVPQELMAVL